MERKALYNALRINSIQNPQQKFKPWQVADYRNLSSEQLFSELARLGIRIDKNLFIALSNEVDSPDEIAEHLYPEADESQELQDQIFLCVFELWRRFVPERQTLSLLCDELDYQIEAFDRGDQERYEGIEDVLSNLKTILDENLDAGGSPQELFGTVIKGCAHDLEGFLYDFIEKQIEIGNHLYAEELLESFSPYVIEGNWFKYLWVRILSEKDLNEAHRLLHQLTASAEEKKDPEFCFALLFYAAEAGEESVFFQLFKEIVPLLESEEDFLDLLDASEDFAHFKDNEGLEREISLIIQKRTSKRPESPFHRNDPDLQALIRLFIPK